MKITAEFVTSAAAAADLPRDHLAEIALVGRSNVGKSSLINALARERVARTSAAPGKTRLANYYRLARGSGAPFYLVDLPGYGYARGGDAAAQEFAELTRTYFASDRGIRLEAGWSEAGRAIRLKADPTRRAVDPTAGAVDPTGGAVDPTGGAVDDTAGAADTRAVRIAALLLVDARHPGLDSDVAAWRWLTTAVEDAALVATKIDKLARGQRIRATRELESVFEHSVLPVSAVTGEGLDELWKLIDRLATHRLAQGRPEQQRGTNSRKEQPRSRDSRPSRPPRAATAPHRRRR